MKKIFNVYFNGTRLQKGDYDIVEHNNHVSFKWGDDFEIKVGDIMLIDEFHDGILYRQVVYTYASNGKSSSWMISSEEYAV